MKRTHWLVAVLLLAPMFSSVAAYGADEVYFTRCNLKVLNGEVGWINWQAAPSTLPANTKVKVTAGGRGATLVAVEGGASYKLDIGAEGDQFLAKFVSRKPVDIGKFPADVQATVKSATVKVGMTKEQVYVAMGPPAKAGNAKTNMMTYEDILATDLWVYARKRAGKNIGVAFDPGTRKVSRTEF